jgi:transposase
MQVESLTLRPKLQGALPVVDHFLRPLELPKLLAPQITPPHYVAALELLVKSVLLQPSALYRIEAWAQRYDPAWLPAGHFGDDALGRALDQLFEADRASLMTALVLQALKTFKVQTEQIHTDSTSVKFCGAYAHQKAHGLQLRRGFSKDHRPDLKQLVYCLSVSADGAVPVHFKAYPGNQADDPTHLETWQCLCHLLDKADFLYVADCKLCDLKTLLYLDQHHGRFITIVPRDRTEVTDFAQQAAQNEVRWEPLWERRACRARRRREIFELASGSRQLQARFPMHWYRSSEKQRRDAHHRQERIQAALQRLKQLNERRGRGPKTEPAIRRKAEQLLAHYHVQSLVEFQIELQQPLASSQKPRRQSATLAASQRAAHKAIPVLSACQNPTAIARVATMDGTFPLVTNTDLSALAVLQKYKYQPHLEKRHCVNKSVLEIAPVFLKNNTRIEALMLVYFIAQLIAALIERTVRHNMARRAIKHIPILPEGRYSKTPTYEQILGTFEGCTKNELYEHDQFLKAFVTPLTEIQRIVLELLDINATVYK